MPLRKRLGPEVRMKSTKVSGWGRQGVNLSVTGVTVTVIVLSFDSDFGSDTSGEQRKSLVVPLSRFFLSDHHHTLFSALSSGKLFSEDLPNGFKWSVISDLGSQISDLRWNSQMEFSDRRPSNI